MLVHILNPFQTADEDKKKGFKKRASLQTLGPSYFVRALVKLKKVPI